MEALAPVRFSTSTGWPQASCSLTASRRETMSVPPPAADPTMMRTGREGKGCACAQNDANASSSAINLIALSWSLSLEPRFSLGEECGNALAKIRGVEAGIALVGFRLGKRPWVRQSPHELLVPAGSKRRARGDAACRRVGFLDDFVVGHDAIHQPFLVSLSRAPDAAFEEDLEGCGASDDAHHSLQLVISFDQPQILHGHAKARRFAAYADVGLRRDEQPAAYASALDERHNRVATGGEGVHRGGDARPVVFCLAGIGALAFKGGDIGPGGKCLAARPADHDAAQRLIVVELLGERAELLPHGERKRIQPLRVAEGNGSDLGFALEEDFAVHRLRSRSSAAEINGQKSRISASVVIEPTSPLDQNTRRSPPAPIIDRRNESSARLPSTRARVK